tara:strand:+ start:876 stop:1556 length:681 start_codon:yes stop_codon:yes gene_type:complete
MNINYINASTKLHETNQNYGKASEYFEKGTMKNLLTIPKAVNSACKIESISSLLDHGCGKGGLIDLLKQELPDLQDTYGYDPGVNKFKHKPGKKFDIVTSIDVLEHVGRDQIASTLKEIKLLTSKFFFFCIDLLPASKSIDGRNAHFLIAPSDWWVQQIKVEFSVMTIIEVGEMKDRSPYPMHLFGCASETAKHLKIMNEFLANVHIANQRWMFNPEQKCLQIYPA